MPSASLLYFTKSCVSRERSSRPAWWCVRLARSSIPYLDSSNATSSYLRLVSRSKLRECTDCMVRRSKCGSARSTAPQTIVHGPYLPRTLGINAAMAVGSYTVLSPDHGNVEVHHNVAQRQRHADRQGYLNMVNTRAMTVCPTHEGNSLEHH